MTPVDLFIPTFNRPDFLKRILSYYDSSKVDFNIIIADSSSISNKRRNKKIILSFPNLKILYLDKFSDKLISHLKFAEMLKYGKSKYSVFCADDDFVIPSGIKMAVDFLEKNPDYSTAHGSYISFFLYKHPFGSNKFWWRLVYPFRSIKSSSALIRLNTHLKYYYQALWAVRRTDVVNNCYKEFIKSNADPYLFGEMLPDMLSLISGKMKRLNTLYCARQAFSTSYSYWPSLMDAKKNGTYAKEYLKFKNCLVKNLVKYGFSKRKSIASIDLNMGFYLKTTLQEHLMGRANLVLNRFPLFLSKLVRITNLIYLFSKRKSLSCESIDLPSSQYFSDFDAIRQVVLKYKI